jgi:hypothetical protein
VVALVVPAVVALVVPAVVALVVPAVVALVVPAAVARVVPRARAIRTQGRVKVGPTGAPEIAAVRSTLGLFAPTHRRSRRKRARKR